MSHASHNALLTTTAIVSAAYAVALLVAPAASIDAFGIPSDATSIWLARLLGAASLSIAALAFFARRVRDLDARRALDGGFLVGFAASLAIDMWAQYLQVMNALGWLNAAIAGALSVAFFYFLAAEDRVDAPSYGRPT